MSLNDEVIEVLRAERSKTGSATLTIPVIRVRVAARRRAQQPILSKVFGPLWELIFTPSNYEVHEAVHQLKPGHPNLKSSGTHEWEPELSH
jgi:hypothetical protein